MGPYTGDLGLIWRPLGPLGLYMAGFRPLGPFWQDSGLIRRPLGPLWQDSGLIGRPLGSLWQDSKLIRRPMNCFGLAGLPGPPLDPRGPNFILFLQTFHGFQGLGWDMCDSFFQDVF